MGKSNAYCSFCRKSYRDVGPLVEGPDFWPLQRLREHLSSYRDVAPLVEGPDNVYVCGDCIELCGSILAMERRRRNQPASGEFSVPPPAEIRTKLDQVLTSEEAKDALIQAVLRHYERKEGGWPSLILLIGPARTSQLLLPRALAHVLGVPFAEMPFGSVTGKPVLNELLQACEFDIQAARRGIIFVDQLDQWPTEEDVLQPGDSMGDPRLREEFRLDNSHLLIIAGGEFVGLDTMLGDMGRDPKQPLTGDDLLAFGIAPELVERLSAIVRVPPPDEDTLMRLIRWADFNRMASQGK